MPTSSTGPVIVPTTVEEVQKDLAASDSLESAVPPAAAPAATAPEASAPVIGAGIPELDEVRRVYGELGVQQVLAEAHQAHLATEHQKLSAVIPGWADLERRQQITNEIRERARAEGYSDAEIDGVTDSRSVLLAYAALQRDKERARRRATDTLETDDGGAPRPARQPRRRGPDLGKLAEQVAKTGSSCDAAKWVIESGLVD